MTKEATIKSFSKIKKEFEKTKKQIKEIESVEGMIDVDLVVSVKGMFFEKVASIMNAIEKQGVSQ